MDRLDFPMLSLEALPPDFDYASFLQDASEHDVDYLAEESSTSTSTVPVADQTLQQAFTPTASTPNKSLSPIPKQRLERRGHTKSRRGCFNCKRRRIKCQESKPACGHCVKTGLKCEYPAAPTVIHQPQHQIPIFSLQDMRFFQHFLLQCYPHHPLGNEGIWTHEVPCLSQKYEYLMHAVLGLAASDLIHSQDDPSLIACAMAHRVKAIKAIKKTLSDVPKANTFEEGNAMMATCFALTFQSVFLEDGMAEYMTFIRGIMIVAIQMYIKGAKFLFTNFMGDKPQELLEPYLSNLPLIEPSWTSAAAIAVDSLTPLCQTEVEKQYLGLLKDITQNLSISSFAAYKSLTKHYGWWIMLPHEAFQPLIDPTNQVCILLATHWIALQQIMTEICEQERKVSGKDESANSNTNDMDMGICRWMKFLNRQIKPEYLPYNNWPMWVEDQLDADPRFFGRKRVSFLRDH